MSDAKELARLLSGAVPPTRGQRELAAALLRTQAEEIERLNEALSSYGVHDPDCCYSPGINDKCDCGFFAALEPRP